MSPYEFLGTIFFQARFSIRNVFFVFMYKGMDTLRKKTCILFEKAILQDKKIIHRSKLQEVTYNILSEEGQEGLKDSCVLMV